MSFMDTFNERADVKTTENGAFGIQIQQGTFYHSLLSLVE